MNRTSFLCLAAAVLLSGCSSVSVKRDYDESFDFSALKTYAWKHDVQPETGVPRIDNDLNDRRIRAAVNEDLQAKGFILADDKAAAHFHVEYFMEFQQRIDSTGGTVSFGVGRSVGSSTGAGLGWSSGGTISDYEEAQLTIDIIDPAAERTIWRGRGKRRSSSSSNPEKITKQTRDAVTRILKKFPPKQK